MGQDVSLPEGYRKILGPESSTANSHVVPAKHPRPSVFANIRNICFCPSAVENAGLSDCKAHIVCTDEVGAALPEAWGSTRRSSSTRYSSAKSSSNSAESWRSGTQGNRPPSGYSIALAQPHCCRWMPGGSSKPHVLMHVLDVVLPCRVARMSRADVRASTMSLDVDFLATCCRCTSRGSCGGS